METNSSFLTTIAGDGFALKVTRIFSSSKAKDKGGTKHGTVLLVKVTNGTIRVGQQIRILAGAIITDFIARIEKDRVKIESAEVGDEVGICLSTSRLRQFNCLLEK
ncbi:MAG: hypothetical protein AAB657_05085 [Patescibacteria group bacterium]